MRIDDESTVDVLVGVIDVVLRPITLVKNDLVRGREFAGGQKIVLG